MILSESIRIYMLNYFIRVLFSLYLNGFVMVGIAAYQESMMENFPVYFQSQVETFSSVFDELREYKFNKRPVYSAKVIRYALFLRYTSIQSYKILLEDFPLPSLSLLQKIASGTTDVMKCAEMLRNDGKISDDICLLFDEIYLQKCEKYFGGDMMGSNDAGELYKGLVCFIIIGLKQSITYIIRSLPEVSIDANWLKEEIFKSLDVLCQSGFNVRAIMIQCQMS